MRLIISFRTPDMNTRDTKDGNHTYMKELNVIISLQLLITAVFSAFVTRKHNLFYAPIRQCSEFSSQQAQIAHHYRAIGLYRGISNSIDIGSILHIRCVAKHVFDTLHEDFER